MLEGRSWRDADGENPGATDTRLLSRVACLRPAGMPAMRLAVLVRRAAKSDHPGASARLPWRDRLDGAERTDRA